MLLARQHLNFRAALREAPVNRQMKKPSQHLQFAIDTRYSHSRGLTIANVGGDVLPGNSSSFNFDIGAYSRSRRTPLRYHNHVFGFEVKVISAHGMKRDFAKSASVGDIF